VTRLRERIAELNLIAAREIVFIETFRRTACPVRAALSGRPSAACLYKLFTCLLLALFLIPFSSCRRGGQPGTLVIAIEQPPRGFDPRFSTTFQFSARVMQLI